MQARLKKGTRRKPGPAAPDLVMNSAPGHTIIIGVDPSLRGTGFGVIEMKKPQVRCIAHGTISCPASWTRSRCLAQISNTLDEVLKQFRPTVAALEGLFFAQNLQTAIIMGEARGASMTALARHGLDMYEIAPRKVKQAIVGYGAAQKLAVAKMVQRLLAIDELPDPDAADALAIALAYSQMQGKAAIQSLKQI